MDKKTFEHGRPCEDADNDTTSVPIPIAEPLGDAGGRRMDSDAETTSCDGSDTGEPKPFDILAAIEQEFGTEATAFVRHLAESEFAEMKGMLAAMGFPALGSDEPGGRPSVGRSPKLANAVLCLRYPFLVPRNRWTGQAIWYDDIDDAMINESRADFGVPRARPFGSTELDALPAGWLARFGLEICEDMRTVLGNSKESADPMSGYRIDQIKEKYGTLRWYSHGAPADVDDDEHLLIALYEAMSARTCLRCGGMDRVRTTGGWISPQCFPCRGGGRLGADIPAEDVVRRYNEMLLDGSLADLVDGQSREWHKAYGLDGDTVQRQQKEVEKTWAIRRELRDLVEKDLLDAQSYAVGTLEDDHIYTVYSFDRDLDKPAKTETDLYSWGEGLGLLAVPLARDIDRMREGFDGSTNRPEKKEEQYFPFI